MSPEFNPYREWLSIPVNELPANYYRLLGLALYESDPNVIEKAADRQMAFVRTFQTGPYSQQSQQLLNELALARITLLDKKKKAQYDSQLRADAFRTPPEANGELPLPPPPPSAASLTPQPRSNNPQSSKARAERRETPSENAPVPPVPNSQNPTILSLKKNWVLILSALVAVMILSGILYGCYTKINNLSNRLDNSVSKDEYIKLDNEKADLEKQVAELQKEKENLQSQIDFFEDENNKRKEAESHNLSIPGKEAGERKTIVINDVEFAFRWCPAGTFTMGSPNDEKYRDSDETQHKVTLTKGFWMLETEVTQKQWKAVMGDNPSDFQGDDLPVECVSWDDCQEFCKKCAQLGFPVQLPTEAQWEYACRAGTTGAYAGNLDDMAWYSSNSGRKTHPVGTKKPNAWGLYDMHGNVWEWCADWYDDYPSGSVTDPTGPSNGSDRVDRGGGWFSNARYCRSALRSDDDPGFRYDILGFRLVKGQ